MKRCLIYIGALLFSLVPLAAKAQIPGAAPIAYLYCYIGTGTVNSPANWTACDAANPLNITGSFSASTSATAASSLPTISAGAGAAVYESLAGALYVQPVFGSTIGGGTQVDATHGLPVNIVAGAGSGGTAIADGATFTEASTSFTPIGGEYVSGGGASCTTGKGCTVQMTIDRMAYVNIGKVGGAATGTAGSAGTGVLTVQGIASMTPLLANPGTIATWGLATVAAGTAPTNALIGGAIYNSSPLTLTTGQSAALQSDASGFLKVNVAAGATVGIAQGASYSAQTFTPIMGLASTNAPTATNGDLWALSISPSSGGVRIDLKDSATNTNPFAVSLASAQVASGAFASGSIAAGAVSAGAFVSGSVLSGAYASGSLASGAVVDITNGTDTAYAGSGSTSLDGYLKGIWTNTQSAIPAGSALIGKVGIDQTTVGSTNAVSIADIGATAVVTSGLLAGTLPVGGATAVGGTVYNPVNVGAEAISAEITAQTNAKVGTLVTDLVGKLITMPFANKENMIRGYGTSSTTAATITVVPSGGGALLSYLTSLQCSNSSATGLYVTLSDTSGVVLYLPATGGSNIVFSTPLVGTGAATAITATLSSNNGPVYCSGQGYKGT